MAGLESSNKQDLGGEASTGGEKQRLENNMYNLMPIWNTNKFIDYICMHLDTNV